MSAHKVFFNAVHPRIIGIPFENEQKWLNKKNNTWNKRYYIELKHTREYIYIYILFSIYNFFYVVNFFFNKMLASKLSVLFQLIFCDTSPGENNSIGSLAIEESWFTPICRTAQAPLCSQVCMNVHLHFRPQDFSAVYIKIFRASAKLWFCISSAMFI